MNKATATWRPTTDPDERCPRLHSLLPPSVKPSTDLENRLRRLDALYARFIENAPVPLWAPGLVATTEMHRQVELYLPLKEIRAAFAAAFREASAPSPSGTALFTATSWYGFLAEFDRGDCPANPAALLHRFVNDYDFRVKFLFALFLPSHFGGAFGRYPVQMHEVALFLQSLKTTGRTIRCLDAACGTGEQAWELAEFLTEEGSRAFQVDGTSVDPLEVFAAAHAFFPHDSAREQQYRQRVSPILAKAAGQIAFSVENLLDPPAPSAGYDVILCNGFLGGPFLHDPATIRHVVGSLAIRLRPNGRLFATDRFHEGWKKLFPPERLRQIVFEEGLHPLDAEEGIACEKVADTAGNGIVERNNGTG